MRDAGESSTFFHLFDLESRLETWIGTPTQLMTLSLVQNGIQLSGLERYPRPDH